MHFVDIYPSALAFAPYTRAKEWRLPEEGPSRAGGDEVESSQQLLTRARLGDRSALERLCSVHLPRMSRWASGRLPRWARDLLNTDDLVQDALLNSIRNLDHFEPRGDGALQAYLRQAVFNRIQDEVRRVQRRPQRSDLEETEASSAPSPLEEAIGRDVLSRYEAALQRLPLRPDLGFLRGRDPGSPRRHAKDPRRLVHALDGRGRGANLLRDR